MESLKLRVEFNFKPYKNIKFHWNDEFYDENNPNHVMIGELDVDVRKGIKLSESQLSKIRKIMKVNQTEVLTDRGLFFSLSDKKLIIINHPKLHIK